MRRALILALLVAVLVPWVNGANPAGAGPSRQAEGPSRFRMFGAGYGHGLGLSQWGAYGLAKRGWGPSKILKHFYSGTRVARGTDPPGSLRIGLVQGKDSIRLEAQVGPIEIRLADPQTGSTVATIPPGETWKVRAASNEYVIVDQAGHVVDRVGGPADLIYVVYGSPDSLVRIPEAGHTYNHGSIEFALYSCAGGCAMRLVLTIDPQDYLYGLGEVPSSWPMSALKTQAIAARTYAFTKAAVSQHRAVCDCALYASSYDQVYSGWDKEGGVDGDRWVSAVNQTDDQVVLNGGQTIQAFYMSSSGGYTENNENVWGGTPIDYLRGVCDPGDYTAENPNAVWERTFTTAQVTGHLGLGIGAVTRFTNVDRGVSGRIMSVTVKGANGQASISGDKLRSSLGLPDDRLWINADRSITDEIRAKYDGLGCSPGLPTSRQVSVAGGERQKFEDGMILHSASAGAHFLRGLVLNRFLLKGGPAGRLGFPTSDVHRLQNGNLRASFERGVITCDPDDSSCSVG
jgi:SpoIID/LytB domain protein